MHELSIVKSIVDIALDHYNQHQANRVECIELEIGVLSGVEMSAFDFAWKHGVVNTILEHAERNTVRVQGEARCQDCASPFEIEELYSRCPVCGSFEKVILKGKELKIKSITIC